MFHGEIRKICSGYPFLPGTVLYVGLSSIIVCLLMLCFSLITNICHYCFKTLSNGSVIARIVSNNRIPQNNTLFNYFLIQRILMAVNSMENVIDMAER